MRIGLDGEGGRGRDTLTSYIDTFFSQEFFKNNTKPKKEEGADSLRGPP